MTDIIAELITKDPGMQTHWHFTEASDICISQVSGCLQERDGVPIRCLAPVTMTTD